MGAHAISRVIGRAGSNINAIRAATGAHIEVDKQTKGQGERIITIKLVSIAFYIIYFIIRKYSGMPEFQNVENLF